MVNVLMLAADVVIHVMHLVLVIVAICVLADVPRVQMLVHQDVHKAVIICVIIRVQEDVPHVKDVQGVQKDVHSVEAVVVDALDVHHVQMLANGLLVVVVLDVVQHVLISVQHHVVAVV